MTACDPDVAFEPDQAPVAVQLVAFVEDHVSVLWPPAATWVGTAEIVTVGGGTTVTVVDFDALPPVPVHVRVYVEVEVGFTTCEPESALAPDHAPLAEQDVALADAQVSVLGPPEATCAGFAVSETEGGAGGAVTVTYAVSVATQNGVQMQLTV